MAESLGDLRDKMAADSELIDRLSFAITDMHLDASGDGLDVGRFLKGMRPEILVLLSSDGRYKAGDLVGAVDRVIGKDPVAIGALK